MNSTPELETNLNAPIYSFFEKPVKEGDTVKYKCKSCLKSVSSVGSTTSSLLKHIKTTNENKHALARQDLADLTKDTPSSLRAVKRA